jgi:type IV pilus assembly protein PilW
VSRPFPRPALFIQRGLTLIELMVSMTLGLIVVGGILGIFAANSETRRHMDDLSRIQENARVAIQLISRSMREAGGNPCGIPPGTGLILNTAEAPISSWWSGGKDFTSALMGYANGTGFPANGSVTMVPNSDAIIAVSANTSTTTVINDTPPNGAMIISTNKGLADGDILFACSTNSGRGVLFQAGAITVVDEDTLSVNRASSFAGEVANMKVTALGKISAEGWFVGNNERGGTSLFRAFIRNYGQPGQEEIAPDVSAMRVTYLLPNTNLYVAANQIPAGSWSNVTAAHIDLTITRTQNPSASPITRTVGLTIKFRNRLE